MTTGQRQGQVIERVARWEAMVPRRSRSAGVVVRGRSGELDTWRSIPFRGAIRRRRTRPCDSLIPGKLGARAPHHLGSARRHRSGPRRDRAESTRRRVLRGGLAWDKPGGVIDRRALADHRVVLAVAPARFARTELIPAPAELPLSLVHAQGVVVGREGEGVPDAVMDLRRWLRRRLVGFRGDLLRGFFLNRSSPFTAYFSVSGTSSP
jgi:hypothetical protein